MPGCLDAEGLEWIGGGEGGDGGIGGDGRRGLEEILTCSSFRSSADCIASPPLLGDNRLHHKLALTKARAIYEC